MRSSDVIRKYGCALTICSDACPEGRKAKGFIQPAALPPAERPEARTAAGSISRGRHLLIAEAEALLPGEKDVTVRFRDEEYILLRAQPVYAGDRLSHWEGTLRLKGVAADA